MHLPVVQAGTFSYRSTEERNKCDVVRICDGNQSGRGCCTRGRCSNKDIYTLSHQLFHYRTNIDRITICENDKSTSKSSFVDLAVKLVVTLLLEIIKETIYQS